MNWKGVIPAITTTFTQDLHVDHSSVTKHCRWLLDNGAQGSLLWARLRATQ